MPEHPLNPDEYREAEGVNPKNAPKELFDSAEKTLDEVEVLAEKMLTNQPILERQEAVLQNEGIVSNFLVEKLGQSAEGKIYIEWGIKTADLMRAIRQYFIKFPDHQITLVLQSKFNAVRSDLRTHSEQHHDDVDYLAQETKHVLMAYDELKKIRIALGKEFGDLPE